MTSVAGCSCQTAAPSLAPCRSPRQALRSAFLGNHRRPRGAGVILRRRQQGSARVTAWFKFGKNGLDAETSGIYGSQGRDDFDKDDVEHYFNYMGMLAVEGTYDKLKALLDTGIPPVDILLIMAASEGDRPKIQELLKAGARCDVKNADGKTALDVAVDDDTRQLIQEGAKATAA